MNQRDFSIASVFLPKIKENGYTFCGVFDSEGKEPNFIYSIAATGIFGAEFIITGDASVNMMQGLMLATLDKFKEFKPGIFSLDNFQVNVNGELQESRLELLDVTGEAWLDNTILSRDSNFNKVYQILFGDLENKLPTDPGNADSFRQRFMYAEAIPVETKQPS